jgi:hypothetical protein
MLKVEVVVVAPECERKVMERGGVAEYHKAVGNCADSACRTLAKSRLLAEGE